MVIFYSISIAFILFKVHTGWIIECYIHNIEIIAAMLIEPNLSVQQMQLNQPLQTRLGLTEIEMIDLDPFWNDRCFWYSWGKNPKKLNNFASVRYIESEAWKEK